MTKMQKPNENPLSDQLFELCVRFTQTPAGQAMLQAKVEEVFQAVLTDVTRYGSGLRQRLTAVVERALTFDPHDIPLEGYNAMLMEIVHRQTAQHFENALQAQVRHTLQELLTPPPAEIKLSKLVEMYVDELRQEAKDGCVCESSELRAFCEIEKSSAKWTSTLVYLAESAAEVSRNASQTKYRNLYCDIRFSVCPTTHLIGGLWFKNEAVEHRLFLSRLFGFERALFQMKAAKTKLIVDVESADELELCYDPHGD